MKYFTSLTILSLASLKVHAFMHVNNLARNSVRSNPQHENNLQRIRYYRKGPESHTNMNMLGMSLEDTMNQIEGASIIVAHQNIQAEILADMGHAILDFATLFAPDTAVLRLLILCARIFNIAADYLPDGTITTDEIFVQSCMLTISCNNFLSIALPMISSTREATFRDIRSFHTIFRPAGFEWTQYKFLLSNCSIEWIELPPSSTFCESEKDLLLIYKGSISKQVGEKRYVYGKHSGKQCHELVGDLCYAKTCLDTTSRKSKRALETHEYSNCPVDQVLQTGSSGAQVLRVDTSALKHAILSDQRIAECFRNLIFNSLQERLEAVDNANNDRIIEYNMTDDDFALQLF